MTRRTRSAAALFAAAALGGAQASAQSDLDAVALQEAEKIERSLVNLVANVRASTVAIVRHVEVEQAGTRVEVPGGLGSGVILDRSGAVFTNVHVIENASRVDVILLGGDVVPATVHAWHDTFDFALLDAHGRAFEPAEWARTSQVDPGQWVIAAGNPRGLGLDGEPVVTLGVVSGLGRLAQGRFSYDNAVQTDAEINPGNSGGPLFDLSGRIVGVNGKIAIGVQGNVSVGVGYAIPAQQIQNFLPDLMAGGQVQAGYSGLVVEPVTAPQGGVVVAAVQPGSPAAKAGMRPGDRVTRINTTIVDSYTTWTNTMALVPNGRAISLRFDRAGQGVVKRFILEAPAPPPRDARKGER